MWCTFGHVTPQNLGWYKAQPDIESRGRSGRVALRRVTTPRPPFHTVDCALFVGTFGPLEATVRASAQISAKYKAKSILPLSSYEKVPLNVYAMREYEFECVLVILFHGGGASVLYCRTSWCCTSKKHSTRISVESLFEITFHIVCKGIQRLQVCLTLVKCPGHS